MDSDTADQAATAPPPEDEQSILKSLAQGVRDHDDLERDITEQATRMLIETENKKDEKRLEKLERSKARFINQKRSIKEKLQYPGGVTQRHRLHKELAHVEDELRLCVEDIQACKDRIDKRNEGGQSNTAVPAGGRLPNESHREWLIRTGKITPFSGVGSGELRQEDSEGKLASTLLDAEDEAIAKDIAQKDEDGPRSHRNLRLPGFQEDVDLPGAAVADEFSLRPRKKRKIKVEEGASSDEYAPSPDSVADARSPASCAESQNDSDDVDLTNVEPKAKRQKKSKKAAAIGNGVDLSSIDDGNEAVYQTRLRDWIERRSRARRRHREKTNGVAADGVSNDQESDGEEEEWFKPSPDHPDHHFDNGLKLPGDIYPSLFDYQKTGVQWLGELYEQQVGGIIGDEMGLGKTVQLISFVAALHYSKKLTKPIIVVAPATVLQQWVNEFHRWWPPFRVSILHSSGSGMFSAQDESEIEGDESQDDHAWEKPSFRSSKAARDIVTRVVKHGHVLVTTYAGLKTYNDILTPVSWGYAVLDEGHKIRNPNTAITVHCKQLLTTNRVILSGTPMQNNLTELWSLFDFIYPARLGSLVSFRNEFEIPIKLGGHANASNLEIMTAQKCAEVLKDAISPYLLQRLKVDVAADLPKKTEQVLFCKLTELQETAYRMFLRSDDMAKILNRTRQSLYGIDILRKICNHPDLLQPANKERLDYVWGEPHKSGKLEVVKSLLPIWKRSGHKILVFSQGTQMLDIIEKMVGGMEGVNYLRMDGKTAIKERQVLVDRFNNNSDLHVFLLTTKVGGLGVNLTGADRVIIYDPDWNPSTDVQARERAWRLGQKREVVIYRLMTAGTIEEKIYHRQIFKQFLTNKVMKDPKQRTNFNLNDLHDLFSLTSYADGKTETHEIFQASHDKDGKRKGSKRTTRPGIDNDPMWGASQTGTVTPASRGHPRVAGETASAVEGLAIAGVAGLEEYKGEEAPPNEEDRIMEGLFARSGVHSTLEHDEVMNGKQKVQADRRIITAEANREAAKAALALRRAEREARDVPIGTITWTGEVGTTGRPTNRRTHAGPSSAGVLSHVAARQGLTASPPGRNSSNSPRPSAARKTAKDFEIMIPQFIRSHGGGVPTKMLVDHFNKWCKTQDDSVQFKMALDKVAEITSVGSRMRNIWKVKEP